MNVVEACSPRGKRIFNVATRTGDRDRGDLDPKIDRVLAATIKPFPREAETPAGYVITLRDRSDSWRMEQLKSQFIENVAHKLRTPLTVIEANIPLLRDEAGTSPGDRASLLGEIERNSTILCRIVDRFVDFTELDSAQNLSPIAPDSVSLKKLVHDVILSVQDGARARGVQIEERGAEDLPLIAGYQGRLSTAFANVLDNAIKFSGRGDQVLVQLRSDQSYVRVEVLDNGPGIPPTEIESVFYIGHQIDADNTGQMPGTGLGLVIARHIVQEHGGEVTITSPRDDGDRGTCVTMLLPQLTPERVHANPNGIAGQFSFDPGTCQKEGSL
jgi:two-component system sensor histidine kinase SenX3